MEMITVSENIRVCKLNMDQQEFSCLVSVALDSMGYSYDTVKQRQLLDISHVVNEIPMYENVRKILTGSTAEGISRLYCPNSDIDIMSVSSDMIIFENASDTQSVKEGNYLLQMERDNVAPGYTMIKCINMKCNDMPKCILSPDLELFDLTERSGCSYLRHVDEGDITDVGNSQICSETEIDEDGDEVSVGMQLSGPSINTIYELLQSKIKVDIDHVYAIPCFCFSLIRNWADRTRYYGWPDKQFISEVKDQMGYVVPVGYKGSKNFELEWRISFAEIEINLIRSFNETQIKMYVLLKMVAKAILKPICKDITSYIIKNLVLWLVERNANEIFTPGNLLSLVMLGLRSLRNKVNLRLFGSYMIPKRNLFAVKITEHEKFEILGVLDDILAEGPMFLMNFKELSQLKKAFDETVYMPVLAEIRTRIWHYTSLRPLDKLVNDEDDEIIIKILLGSILIDKYLELDDHQKEIIEALFFENTYNGKTFEDLDEKDFGKVKEYNEKTLLSTINGFFA